MMTIKALLAALVLCSVLSNGITGRLRQLASDS